MLTKQGPTLSQNGLLTPRNRTRFNLVLLSLPLLFFVVGVSFAQASETNGTISSTYKYAWSNVAGYINFAPTNGGLTITDSAVTGYAWGANTGWINFNATQSHVTNDGAGNLGGYAWDSGAGWFSFSGVTINSSGVFHGTATGSNSRVINFDCTNCSVRTDWRPASARTVAPVSTPASAPSSAPSSSGVSGGTVTQNNGVSVSNVLLGLKITPNPSALPVGGGKVTYTYSVSNIGVAAINGVKISDVACSPITYISGDMNGDSFLYFNTKLTEVDGIWALRNVNEVWIYSCTTNLSKTTQNIATVTGYSSGFRTEAVAKATVVVGTPMLSLRTSTTTPSVVASATLSAPVASVASVKNLEPLSVKQLQQFLNTHGFVIALMGAGSSGNETNYFGSATKTALAKFQAKNSINPAVGYFGAVTQTVIQQIIMLELATISSVPPQQTTPATQPPQIVPVSPAPIPNNSLFTRDLYLGTNGSDVAALQNFLIEHATGFASQHLAAVGASGYFGTLTQNALKEYQAENGITPLTGSFNSKTRELIQQNL